jgi:hypothetical protein
VQAREDWRRRRRLLPHVQTVAARHHPRVPMERGDHALRAVRALRVVERLPDVGVGARVEIDDSRVGADGQPLVAAGGRPRVVDGGDEQPVVELGAEVEARRDANGRSDLLAVGLSPVQGGRLAPSPRRLFGQDNRPGPA